jgi:membrane associated rhomboid family serine protease
MGDKSDGGHPVVTYLLLAFLVLIQFYVSLIPEAEVLRLYEVYALFPSKLFGSVGAEGLVTYMFLHGSWIHFIVNAVSLWGSGGTVEREIGSIQFAIIYLGSGVVAGLVHSLLYTSSSVPLVGASGAIFGVIAVLFLLMPFKVTFTLLIPLPSVLVGIMLSAMEFSAFWFASDITVAHDAHLSGFLFGCVSAFAIDRKRALKGLIIAIAISAILYYLGVRFDLV